MGTPLQTSARPRAAPMAISTRLIPQGLPTPATEKWQVAARSTSSRPPQIDTRAPALSPIGATTPAIRPLTHGHSDMCEGSPSRNQKLRIQTTSSRLGYFVESTHPQHLPETGTKNRLMGRFRAFLAPFSLGSSSPPAPPSLRSQPRPRVRARNISLPSRLAPRHSFHPSYPHLNHGGSQVKGLQMESKEEKWQDVISSHHHTPPSFTAPMIPDSRNDYPVPYQSRRAYGLSSPSADAVMEPSTVGSFADAASSCSRSSGSKPSSPNSGEDIVHQWLDTLGRHKQRKPGVTWDVDTGSPAASFSRLMDIDDHTDMEERV